MKFNNLDCNILYLLTGGHPSIDRQYHVQQIYNAFPDIPENNVTQAIKGLHRDGRIVFNTETNTLTATPGGIQAISSSAGCPLG